MINVLENINISIVDILSKTILSNNENGFVIGVIIQILLEAIFAGLSALGFSIISDPPKRLVIYTVILAAIARGLRYAIMVMFGVGIVMSTFIVSLIVGFLGIFTAYKVRCPMEVISFPALLPMIPGVYAYETIISFVMYGQANSIIDKNRYLISMFDNGVMSIGVISALAIGVTVPFLIFYEKTFTFSRKKINENDI